MTTIAGHEFDGPFELGRTQFNNVPAVYVISDSYGKLIDVGETEALADRMANHERKPCWQRNAVGTINVYAKVTAPKLSRLLVESTIRTAGNFSCGVR